MTAHAVSGTPPPRLQAINVVGHLTRDAELRARRRRLAWHLRLAAQRAQGNDGNERGTGYVHIAVSDRLHPLSIGRAVAAGVAPASSPVDA